MNVLFTDTITVYNWYREGRADKWQRTILTGVQYRETIEKLVTENGIQMHRMVSITIPVNADAGGRHYMDMDEFAGTSDRESYWTLNQEKNLDVIVLGAVYRELTDDYDLAALMKEHGYATVKGLRDNTLRRSLKHWKVTCV